MSDTIAVLGAGSWGTALAIELAAYQPVVEFNCPQCHGVLIERFGFATDVLHSSGQTIGQTLIPV